MKPHNSPFVTTELVPGGISIANKYTICWILHGDFLSYLTKSLGSPMTTMTRMGQTHQGSLDQ